MTAEVSHEPRHSIGLDIHESTMLEMSNEELDALFRGSPSGGIPDGDMRGTVLLFPGTPPAKPLATVVYQVAWQGKVVDRQQRLLKNKITPFRLQLIAAELSIMPSWVDEQPCVVLDYSQTSVVAQMVRDEIRLVAPGLYLGVIWMWQRRVGWFTLRGSPELF